MKRENLIQRIADAIEKPCPAIVEVSECLGEDGKWYSPFGLPWGFRSAHQSRVVGYCYQMPNGTQCGTREQTRQALLDKHAGYEAINRAEFVRNLEAMGEEDLSRQASYWLK